MSRGPTAPLVHTAPAPTPCPPLLRLRYVDIDHLKVEDAFGGTSWLVISYSAASGAMPAGGGGRAERLELGGSDRAHAQQLLSELSLAMARSV